MPPFDLATAARHGIVPVRMFAYYLTMAVRDSANRLTLDPTHASTPGAVKYFVEGIQYDLMPPPDVVFQKLIPLLRDLIRGTGDRFTARLGSHEFIVQVEIASATVSRPIPRRKSWWKFGGERESEALPDGECATLHVPLMPDLSQAANDLFRLNADPDGAIYFDDAELV